MSIEKLQRVCQRIKERNPSKSILPTFELDRAIMYEVGTDVRTLWANKIALVKLGWIKKLKSRRFRLTYSE